MMPNSVQNLAIVSNTSAMTTQSTLSEVEMDSLPLYGKSVVKKEPDSNEDETINDPMGDGRRGMLAQSTLSDFEMDMLHLQGEYVVKKEPDSDGDEKINEPMRERRRAFNLQVCGNSENSREYSDEESILGLPSDISVPNEKNVFEDLPLDCVLNMNLSSSSVDPVEPAVETQDTWFHSEFHEKTEPSTQDENNLRTENEDISENTAQGVGVPPFSDMQMNDCSGAASGCISQSTYTSLPAAFVKTHRLGRNEASAGVMPGLLGEVSPRDCPTRTSRTTPECERGLSGPSRRDGSNGSNSTGMLYNCQICNKTFTHNRHLNFHMRIHAEDRTSRNDKGNNAVIQSEPKLFACTVCEFKSVRRKALYAHKKIHSAVKPYKCQECEYASITREHLKIHQRTHSGLKPYKCAECEFTSAYANCLKIHQRTHSGLKPYKCTECNYAAARSCLLQKHQRTHSGLKPYKCAECDFRAAQKCQVKTHELIHSGVKPYKCAECDYTAIQPSNLQRHQRVHSGEKPYKCSECNYAAVRIDVMKKHQLTHSRSKP